MLPVLGYGLFATALVLAFAIAGRSLEVLAAGARSPQPPRARARSRTSIARVGLCAPGP